MKMKIKQFDIVKLTDENRATILQVCKNEYYAQIINKSGNIIDNKYITKNDIKSVLYQKER